MSVVISSLANGQEKKLLSLFGHVRLHLLYKASIHGYAAAAFHNRCDRQGPTVVAAYNKSGYVFGVYTSKDYAQTNANINDEKAFLYSIHNETEKPLRVTSTDGRYGFSDTATGPNFSALLILHNNTAIVHSNPGANYNFVAADMHGNDLQLIECEVYRVEDVGLLRKPWRNAQWNSVERRKQLQQTIQNYKPELNSVNQARVLLVGPVGAGKSSFFNSINSVFRGNITGQAISGTAGKSVTTQFRSFSIKAGKGGKPLPIILCDTMGLEEALDDGLNLDDIVSICKGNVEDRYQFNSLTPLQADAPGYRRSEGLCNQVHCLVYVMDTCKISLLSTPTVEKLAAIRRKANQMGIPQLLLMTKVDEACPLVAEDLRNVYLSHYIQKKMQELSVSLGIPMSCILPIKNYSQELELDLNIDILLLSAMEQMLNYADGFFENQVVPKSETKYLVASEPMR